MAKLMTRRFTGTVIGLLLAAGVLSGCDAHGRFVFPSSEEARGAHYERTPERSDH